MWLISLVIIIPTIIVFMLLFGCAAIPVLLGIAALGVLTFPLGFAFYVFEIVLVATLQAFIFAILTAIYLGGATSAGAH